MNPFLFSTVAEGDKNASSRKHPRTEASHAAPDLPPPPCSAHDPSPNPEVDAVARDIDDAMRGLDGGETH